MLRTVPFVVSFIGLACSSEAPTIPLTTPPPSSTAWDVASFRGQPLPYVEGAVTLTSGTLTLSPNGSFTEVHHLHDAKTGDFLESDAGTWAVSGGDLTLVSAGSATVHGVIAGRSLSVTRAGLVWTYTAE